MILLDAAGLTADHWFCYLLKVRLWRLVVVRHALSINVNRGPGLCIIVCNRVKHIVMVHAERADLPIEIVGSCFWHGHSFDFIVTFLSFHEIKEETTPLVFCFFCHTNLSELIQFQVCRKGACLTSNLVMTTTELTHWTTCSVTVTWAHLSPRLQSQLMNVNVAEEGFNSRCINNSWIS